MTTLNNHLKALGFEQLPSFDSSYFRYRKSVGFLVMVNVKTKHCYSVFTINAVSCLQSAIRLVKGEYADRARDLQTALKLSALYDWEIYFNNSNSSRELRDQLKGLLEGYQSLNTNKSRLDQTEPSWAYLVSFKHVERSFVICENTTLNNITAISKFLLKWRSSLEAGLNRGTINLQQYYTDCDNHTLATKQWMSNNAEGFVVTAIPEYDGKPRGLVMEYVNKRNVTLTNTYRRKL